MTTSNAELLDSARNGSQAAWQALVAQYTGLIWSVARGYRLPTDDAADAVQMTWLRLLENLDRIRDPERLAGWLATTVRRECLQLLRKSGIERPSLDDSHLQIADTDPPVDTSMLLDERDKALWQAFQSLGEKCRHLLRVLMSSPPPTYQDVAAALDIAIGTIGPARQRCLNQLRSIVTGNASLAGSLREEAR
jgi:RNA polymerase sigma factor (sigma-70 family)